MMTPRLTFLLLAAAARAQLTRDARPFLRGRAFSDTGDAFYSRLPSAAAGAVRDEVWCSLKPITFSTCSVAWARGADSAFRRNVRPMVWTTAGRPHQP